MTGTDRSNLATCAGLGMLSGAVAWTLMMLTKSDSYMSTFMGVFEVNGLTVLPGLIFGLIIGFLWNRRGRASLRVVLGYSLAAGIAHFLAVHVALYVFNPGPWISDTKLAASGILAGLTGSCLLGVATVYLLPTSYRSALGLPVLIGGAAGAFLPLANPQGDVGLLAFLVFWQGAYAAGLARLLRPGAVALPGSPALEVGKSRA